MIIVALRDLYKLIYMRARYYAPEIGRFVNLDSVVGSINDSTSLNRYAFCGGNHVMYVDPTGHIAEKLEYTTKKSYKQMLVNFGVEESAADFMTEVAYSMATGNVGDALHLAQDVRHGASVPQLLLDGLSFVPIDKVLQYVKNVDTIVDAGKTVKRIDYVADAVKAYNVGSANTFPDNPDDFLSSISREKVIKSNGTINQTIYTNDNVRIRAEQHLLLDGETYNPRHHGVHYHVEYKIDATKSWNNKRNIMKVHPDGYTPGSGTGFLPGELFPGIKK